MHLTDLRKVFGPDGLIAENLSGYEFRPQQLQMAESVAGALRSNQHLITEAGTGVGKSFAYLIPAIDLAISTEQTVVISTNTISLQEQLIEKDIPFLQKVLPFPFKAVLAKGRGNYLSRRRLSSLLAYERGLFDTLEEVQEVKRIVSWVEITKDGSRADLEKQPMPEIWQKVVSDRDNCLGRKCPTYETCFYFKARREMAKADIIIVNHHLLFSDLEIRKNGAYAAVLPDYSHLIIDEAQHIESIATDHASIEITNTRIKWFLDSLHNPRSEGGLLVRFRRTDLAGLVDEARKQANYFFGTILDWANRSGVKDWGRGITTRVNQSDFVSNTLDFPLRTLGEELKEMRESVQTDDEEQEIMAHQSRCAGLRQDLDLMIRQTEPGYVYWINSVANRRTPRISLNATPVNISAELREHLFGKLDSVIMTSATLSTNRNFDYFKGRVGISNCPELLVGSPYDYMKQVEIHIPAQMPDPRAREFPQAVIDQTKHYLKMTHGKAFVLFTSYRMLDEVYEAVAPYLERLGIDVFKQGGEMSRSVMLKAFKRDTDSVLFGTSSFWEGVDVQGESLSNVIITKLPFEVPTHPVVEARMKQIEERGGNPFMEFSLPEAIIRFKQGFGRLIRTKTDKGIVVVLDPRVKTKFYGKQFLNSLPACRIVTGGKSVGVR